MATTGSILALSIPAFIWLVPTLWMVSLSFQPNEVLARTTSSTCARAGAGALHRRELRRAVRLRADAGLVPQLGDRGGGHDAWRARRLDHRGLRAGAARVPVQDDRSMVFCLIGLMVPEQAVFIPLYTMFADFGWHNSYHALILPRMAVPIGVFLMMQFFKAIPKDIEEAARIDGVGWFQIFWHVMLPLARPAMMTLAILTFLYAWNDYLWPLVSAQQRE